MPRPSMHNPSLPLRGPLLSSAFRVAMVATKTVDSYPCIAVCGKSGVGKSTYLNQLCWTEAPRDEHGHVSNTVYARNAQEAGR